MPLLIATYYGMLMQCYTQVVMHGVEAMKSIMSRSIGNECQSNDMVILSSKLN